MIWTNPAEFFSMGGYGQYVWGSVGVTVIVLCAELILLGRRRKRALLQIKRELTLRQDKSQ